MRVALGPTVVLTPEPTLWDDGSGDMSISVKTFFWSKSQNFGFGLACNRALVRRAGEGTGAEWPPVEQICHREVSLNSLPYQPLILLHLQMCCKVWYDTVKMPFSC